MWPDPTDPALKKPYDVKGTPANKFVTILALCGVVATVGYIFALSYTPHFQKKIERLRKQTEELHEARKTKAFINDPLIQQAIGRKARENEMPQD